MSDTDRTARLTAFKNSGRGVQDMRRKRAELSVTLRKQARDEQLLKRRALSPDAGSSENNEPEVLPMPSEIVQGLKSKDVTLKLASAKAARRMLSREQNPPITVMMQAGVIKPLVEALDHHECPDLQFEAAWALTNIASGTHEQTMAVVYGGALPKFVSLVSAGGSVGEQSAWAIGNIAGDGAEARDLALREGALPALLPSLSPSVGAVSASQLRNAVWTYSNLCRNKNPLVKFELVSPALPQIAELLDVTDHDVLADACWAISYLTDGPNERIETVQTTPSLLPRLIRLLDHSSGPVKTAALRAVGNMVTGSDEQTDRCLEAGCLDYIARLLRCGKSGLVKEATWAVSNVLAGTQEQIERAITDGMLDHIVHVLTNEDSKCQKEAAWAVTNLCLGGAGPHLAALLHNGVLEPFCDLLQAPDHRTITVVLEGITNLLQAAEKFGEVEQLCLKLEEINALDRIESLQHHENEQVYQKVSHILDTYFSVNDDVGTVPAQTDGEYQFGSTNQNIGNF